MYRRPADPPQQSIAAPAPCTLTLYFLPASINPEMLAASPSYLVLYQSGELQRRVQRAAQMMQRCILCPRVCATNRLAGEAGECQVGRQARVWSYHPHFGEEPPLVGWGGSGTIFFSGCNLNCAYCQNYEISQMGQGHEVTDRQLAGMMLELQEMGCHNINLVSPSHLVPQILAALTYAVEEGLHLPLVYNTGGYDSMVALRLLDGVVDIYMPDMKYADPAVAERYSGVRDYPKVNRRAMREMHRQVGDLILDNRSIAMRGLIVRHLVLPGGLAGTAEIVRFLAEEISRDTYINIMDQYRPCYKVRPPDALGRRITPAEYAAAVRLAMQAGLHRGL